jgi:hypothetical protein
MICGSKIIDVETFDKSFFYIMMDKSIVTYMIRVADTQN